MTKKTVTKPRARRKEQPVDAEIRAAGERIGYAPTPPSASPTDSPTMFRPGVGAANFRDSLSAMLTGGLWVTPEERDHCGGPYAAMLHLAGVQAKILATAVAHYDSTIDGGFGRDDWAIDNLNITRADLVTALNALTTYVNEGRHVLDSLCMYGDYRSSMERQHKKEPKEGES